MLSLGVALLTTVLFQIPRLWETPGYSRFDLDAAKLRREAKHLDEQFEARNLFVAIANEILCMLARGTYL